jgi:ribosomal-protein-alanine N-acetyltransferase
VGISPVALVSRRSQAAQRLRFDPMRTADVDAVMEIERRTFAEPWTPGLFLHELKVPFARSVVVRLPTADEVMGYVCWWHVGDEVHILNLAVRPEMQRQGIGRALVDLVVEEAGAAGAGLVTLEVREGNAAAFVLYGALGFERTGRRRDYYAPGVDAIIMSRGLRTRRMPDDRGRTGSRVP